MRLGFDAKRIFHNNSGLGNYGRSLIRHISEHFAPDDLVLYSPSGGLEQYQDFAEKYDATRVSPTQFGSIWRANLVRRELRRDDIDIYHGLSQELPFGAKVDGCKYIVTIHDMIPFTRPYDFPMIDRLIYHQKLRNAIHKADGIIAVSHSTKLDIHRFFEPKTTVAVIPPFISLPDNVLPEYSTSLPKRYYLYVGALTARKNIEIIVQAYEALPPEDRIPIVIVGRLTAHTANLKKYSAKQGVERSFIWRHDVTDEMLPIIYKGAEALIYPSHYEGFGLPVVEAIHQGTPVIVSNASSLPEAGGPAAITFDPTDAQSLIHAMAKGQRRERASWVADLQRHVRDHYGTEATLKRLLDFYENVYRS